MDQHPQGVSRGAAVGFNFNYITSGGGVLKILEVLFGLICWAVLAATQGSWCVDDCTSGRAFGLVVTIAAWILTLWVQFVYMCLHGNTAISIFTEIGFKQNAKAGKEISKRQPVLKKQLFPDLQRKNNECGMLYLHILTKPAV